jgi:hypothetical protein
MTRRTQLVAAAASIGVLLAIIVAFRHYVAGQQPRQFWDSSAYLETADRPFAWVHFFYPKPLLVPVLYRWVGTDPWRIAAFQEWLALCAWLALATTLGLSFDRTRARIAGALAAVVLLFDPYRLGYCDAILSESVNDSLLALLFATVVALARFRTRPRARRALLATAAGLAVAWILARDSNAVVALVAAAGGLVAWRRQLRGQVGTLAVLGALAALSVFTLWSTTVSPPLTHLTFQKDWPEDFGARITYSTMNNVLERVLPDPEASAFFVERGLPQIDELRAQPERYYWFADSRYELARRWIESSARDVWISYLVRHPIARLEDQVDSFWTLAGAARDEHALYMPHGWRHSSWMRALGSNHVALLALVAVAAVALWRRRADALSRVAACAIASGWLGSVAAFYGDAIEVGRHCYGSGEQVVLGLVLAGLVLLDRGIHDPDRS